MRIFLIWLLIFAFYLLYGKIGGFDDNVARPAGPTFSREECFDRQLGNLQGRNPDIASAADLTDDQISTLSRLCVIEESDYYNW